MEAGRGTGRPGAILLGLLGARLLALGLGLRWWRRVLLLLRLLLRHGRVLVQLLVVVLLQRGGGRGVGRPGTHVTLDNLVFGFTILGRRLRPLYLHFEAVFVLRCLLLRLLRLLLLGPAGGRGAAAATGAAGR